METFDIIFKSFIYFGIFNASSYKQRATLLDVSPIIYIRMFIKFSPFLLSAGLLAKLIFNKLEFDEFVETLLYAFYIVQNTSKILMLMLKQSQLINLRRILETNLATLQNDDEQTTHRRYSDLAR